MSDPRLPVELLDHVVDFLQDSRDALKTCCLTSKSWIPRTRKHLFAEVGFYHADDVESWKITFPNPSTSPALYTKALYVGCPRDVTAADSEEGGWILSFSRVVHFGIEIPRIDTDGPANYLTPFHGFSPAIKSVLLHLTALPSPHIFDLVYSFPLLEDLSVTTHITYISVLYEDKFKEQMTVAEPRSTPAFTGFLRLSMFGGIRHIASPLLALPSGLHFRGLHLIWCNGKDTSLTAALVERCGSTLEFLYIRCFTGTSILHLWPYQWLTSVVEPLSPSIDLSGATKLRDVAFKCKSKPQWIVMALRTVTHHHRSLKRIEIDAHEILFELDADRWAGPGDFRDVVGEAVYEEWMDLDRLLDRLRESHSIRLNVLCNAPSSMGEAQARGCMEKLLPKVMRGGMAESPRTFGPKVPMRSRGRTRRSRGVGPVW